MFHTVNLFNRKSPLKCRLIAEVECSMFSLYLNSTQKKSPVQCLLCQLILMHVIQSPPFLLKEYINIGYRDLLIGHVSFFKDLVRHPHGQGGVPAPGGPPCIAHARGRL